MEEENPVITFEKQKDQVCLDEKYKFNTKTTLGLVDGGDFYVHLEFVGLNRDELKHLFLLSKEPRRIKIESSLIKKAEYNISHIVVTEFSANTANEMVWKCLSDDPELYKGLNIN